MAFAIPAPELPLLCLFIQKCKPASCHTNGSLYHQPPNTRTHQHALLPFLCSTNSYRHSFSLAAVNVWEPASHRSGWFGRLRALTKGGSPPSLNFELRCISRCASLTPRLPSRADVSLDSSTKPLARLSRSAWKCVH